MARRFVQHRNVILCLLSVSPQSKAYLTCILDISMILVSFKLTGNRKTKSSITICVVFICKISLQQINQLKKNPYCQFYLHGKKTKNDINKKEILCFTYIMEQFPALPEYFNVTSSFKSDEGRAQRKDNLI